MGTDGFWLTRPIGRGRMLASKVTSAAILFVIAPVVLIGVLARVGGVTGGPVPVALGGLAEAYGFTAALGIMLATLTRTLAQVVFAAVACVVGWFLSTLAVALVFNFAGVPAAQRSFSVSFQPWLAWTLVATVLIHQYWTRRHVRSRLLLAGCLPLLALGVVGMPLLPLGRKSQSSEGKETAAIALAVEPARIATQRVGKREKYSLQVNLRVKVTPTPLADGRFPAPAGGWLDFTPDSGERVPVRLSSGVGWEPAARDLVLGRVTDHILFSQYGRSTQWLDREPTEGSLAGFVQLWLGRMQIVGEFSPEAGATMTSPSGWLRVLSVETPGGWERALVVEERDFDLVSSTSASLNPERDSERERRWVDVLLLVNRAQGQAEMLNPSELGGVALNHQVTHFRRIYLRSARTDETWLKDAVIVKVRIERDGVIERPLEVPVTPVRRRP
ncbi:ABC transporter permease [Horticoccus sp. 23ND18S-11]|uniref:ABC transporter permease n=1 Tax=Horticoccus sp. 23ND18S-11 TaxID=3391832 RepID=UPI0039C8F133